LRVVDDFFDTVRCARYVREGIGFLRVRSRTIVRCIRCATPLCKGVERVVEHFFGSPKQVSVEVEREADRRVASTHRDLLGMGAGGDPQCDRRVTKVVRP
jgi:hypothetical protein